MVTHGDSKTFDITPNAGYKIDDVLVNGESQGNVATYTFFDIRENSTIKAYFSVIQGIDDNENAPITVFSHSHTVSILNKNLVPIKQVEIMDMYGRVVWIGPVFDEKTEITLNVATGIYNVRIVKADNQYQTTKIVIR